MNTNEVQKLLGTLEQVYPNRVGTGEARETITVWTALLMDADPAKVFKAAIQYMRDSNPHPPTPGQLLELVKENDRLTPHEAWGRVREQIQAAGYAGTPDLDALTLDAIEAVGGPWEVMCKSLLTSEIPSLRARFLEAYVGMSEKRERKQDADAYAPALHSLVRPLVEQYDPRRAKGGEG
tara:strand:+ start:1907 stop:2446 length:540 start_codon:yes stop_codon:yes gene_type:complete